MIDGGSILTGRPSRKSFPDKESRTNRQVHRRRRQRSRCSGGSPIEKMRGAWPEPVRQGGQISPGGRQKAVAGQALILVEGYYTTGKPLNWGKRTRVSRQSEKFLIGQS